MFLTLLSKSQKIVGGFRPTSLGTKKSLLARVVKHIKSMSKFKRIFLCLKMDTSK
jgi:hypothetical protein